MKVVIHRGAEEIGGNCVEISTAGSRIILDAGMPLTEIAERPNSQPSKPSHSDLERLGIILPIAGFYQEGEAVHAILLSHAHADHYGLLEHTLPDPFGCESIRIFIPPAFPWSKAKRCLPHLGPYFEKAKISKEEILNWPERMIMVFRGWMLKAVFGDQLPPGSKLLYSYWPGYLEQPELRGLKSRLGALGCPVQCIHASGHMHYGDIMKFIEECQPANIMPIHTVAAGELTKRIGNCVGTEWES